LEELGNSYLSLLVRTTIASKVYNGSSALFNETCIGNFTGHKDVEVGSDTDQEMLQVVDDHHRELSIADSKQMMIAIGYGMSFELLQFSLFHVLLHIDTTSDTNKEGGPFVTVNLQGLLWQNVLCSLGFPS
jgi:hypothetical protein